MTGTGTDSLVVVSPLPRLPLAAQPQHCTVPSCNKAQALFSLTEIAVAGFAAVMLLTVSGDV
jgi:hypothetical protein